MLKRRSFLTSSLLSSGALALSPAYNHLLGATKQDGPPHRFVFIRKSNGNIPKYFSLPSFSEAEKKNDHDKIAFEANLDKHELPGWLNSLSDHKENMTILHGLSMTMCGGGHYSFTGCMGVYLAGRNVVSRIKRATIDFELAKLFPSPFGHVEFSLASGSGTIAFRKGIVSGFSAPAPQQRNYCYADPQTAYNELFKSVTNTSEIESENSLLDYLKEQEKRRVSGLDGLERMKITNHLISIDSIRDRNNKVSSLSKVIAKNLPKIDKIHADGGPNASLTEKQAAFTDVLVAAFKTGLTNVVTYTIDDLGTPITTLPGNKSKIDLHRLGHNAGSDQELRDIVKASHMNQVSTIINKLKATPEGNGTMFDNTTVIYMPESGAGHHGPNNEAPMVIMSGKNSKLDIAGRYIRLPFHATEGHYTIGNWYTTLLNAYGNPIEHYGDLDQEMTRKKMKQTGAIDRFMS